MSKTTLKDTSHTWKNLKNLIHSSKYCGICLETCDELFDTEAEHFIDAAYKNKFTLKEILCVLFENSIQNILLSRWICKLCKISAVNSYIFITKTKQNAEIYAEFISQMSFKLEDISHHLASKQVKCTVSNALMVLNVPEYYEPGSQTLFNKLEHLTNSDSQNDVKSTIPSALPLRIILKTDFNSEGSPDNSIKIEPIEQIFTKTSTDSSCDSNFSCEHCQKIFREEQYLRKHMLQFHSNITIDNSCSVCKMDFKNEKELFKHMSTHKPNERHKCDLCSVDFRNRRLYEQHTLSAIHRSRLRPEQKKFMKLKIDLNCSICQLQCRGVKHLKYHLATHDPNSSHRCVYCNLEFNTRNEYKKHARKISHKKKQYPDKVLECEYCNYTAYYTRNLRTHILAKHTKDNSKLKVQQETHLCHICNKKFKNPKMLDVHIRRHAIVEGKVEQKRYEKTCHICGKIYCGSSSMKKHMRLHTGERPYKCEICKEGFMGASERKVHILRKHSEKTVSCPLCKRWFHARDNLRSHVRKVHWKRKEKFDYTKLEGLKEEDYKILCDRRKVDYMSLNSG